MKVIFLDFDGVITTAKSRYNLDKDKIDLLGQIIDATDAKIVISSSWRRNTLDDTKTYLSTISHRVPFIFPYLDKVVDVSDRMYSFKLHRPDKHFRVHRGLEIHQYLDEHPEIKQYVILDDDMDMLLCQKDNFVKTNSVKGLSMKYVTKAISILNK